jgi:hypothetical protein
MCTAKLSASALFLISKTSLKVFVFVIYLCHVSHDLCRSLFVCLCIATGAPSTAYWNPARTVRTFLEDLHLFLTVDHDKHKTITPNDSRRVQKDAESVQCECSHGAALPWPPVDLWMADNHEEDKSVSSSVARPLPATDMNTRCGISGRNVDEPGVTLGFGIYYEKTARGKISISSDFEPLSYDVFKEGSITLSTLGNRINYFLPFAINQVHWERARPILKAVVAQLAPQTNEPISQQIFFVLGELWKSKVVEMMKGGEHCSEKVLKGFCAIHHLLLSVDMDTQKVRALPPPTTAKSSQEAPDNATSAIKLLGTKVSFLQEQIHLKKEPTPTQCGAFLRGITIGLTPEMKRLSPEIGEAIRHEFADIGWNVRQNNASLENTQPPAPLQMLSCLSRCISILQKKEASNAASAAGDTKDEWSQPVCASKNSKRSSSGTLARYASSRVSSFISSPDSRTKKNIPDFGSFLPLLLLSDLKWDAVKLAFIEELLCRNAMWVLKSEPHLAGRLSASERCKKSWKPSAVGLRLTAFQVLFLINSPMWSKARNSDADENQNIFQMYEKLRGAPSPDMIQLFQKQAKAVQELSHYPDFFRVVGIRIPDGQGGIEYIGNLLIEAIKRSSVLGYHSR